VPARATIMDEASEERSRNVTDAPRLVYVIIFMPTCGQKDTLALKFYRYHVSEHIQTDPTYFGAVTPSSGSALFVLTKVTVVKIVH